MLLKSVYCYYSSFFRYVALSSRMSFLDYCMIIKAFGALMHCKEISKFEDHSLMEYDTMLLVNLLPSLGKTVLR